MGTTELSRGQNVALPEGAEQLRVSVGWTTGSATEKGPQTLDLIALLTDGDRRARSDDDIVFYNQRSTPDGSVVHTGRTESDTGGRDDLSVDLTALTDDVASVVIAASTDEGPLGDLSAVEWTLHTPDGEVVTRFPITDLSTERVVVVGEVYRRQGAWRVRAVGQGWSSGLSGLLTDYGVDVVDAPADDSDDADGSGVAGHEAHDTATAEESATPTAVVAHSTTTTVETTVVQTRAPADAPAGDPPAGPVTEVRRTTTVSHTDAVVATGRVAVAASSRPKAALPAAQLSVAPSWVRSRLFSVAGIGGAGEQENRATSALLWVMAAVRPLGRALTVRAGAPSGPIETYLEVPYRLGESTVIPDGVIRIGRPGKVWTALVEVKTSSNDLGVEQLTNYVRVAKREKFDALLTISNQVTSDPAAHPVTLPAGVTGTVKVVHLSWTDVMHEIRMLIKHHRFDEQLPLWMLDELLRYLEHPKSGAMAFSDMGPTWVDVRDGCAHHTLAAGDRIVKPVVANWNRLARYLALRLTSHTGRTVKRVVPRKHAADPVLLDEEIARNLADEGRLSLQLRVPETCGPLRVLVDVRTTQIEVSTVVTAPTDGTPKARVTWLLKQLKNASDDVVVEAQFPGPAGGATKENLASAREKPARLLGAMTGPPASFRLSRLSQLGLKRSGPTGSVVSTVVEAVDAFFDDVVAQVAAPETATGPAQDLAPQPAADDDA
ncbi:TerD family protein [Nakamurella flava]|uniref:TerD family protein n=1 Tax=Nakamurella flava TaxID=2576308 RepID=A0A4U6QAF4_9ACTN|nr:TerD family protein [Nakamurella flava]TKV56889.1 TerD family protein [Nakamurella flava]